MPKTKDDKSGLNEILISMGKTIENLLQKQKMSRADFACALGVSENSVSGYIRGKQTPSLETLYKISQVLGISICNLINDSSVDNEKIEQLKKSLSSFGWELKEIEADKFILRNITGKEIEMADGLKLKSMILYKEGALNLSNIIFEELLARAKSYHDILNRLDKMENKIKTFEMLQGA